MVTLFVYNRLIADRELVVVQSAGVSRMGLAAPALLSSAVIAIIGYSFTLVIVPETFRSFKELQWSIRNDVSQIMLREGAFNQLTRDLTVYVRGRGQSGELQGILVHDTRSEQGNVTLMAEQGRIIGKGDEPRIMLLNGSRQEIEGQSGELSVLYFDSYSLEFGPIVQSTQNRFADNRERSTSELLSLSESDGISPINVSRMRAEAHQRLTSPLGAIGYAVIALAFLLRGNFDRRGQTTRIVAAILTVVALQAANLGVVNLASQSTSYIGLMYVSSLLPIVAGVGILNVPSWRNAFRTAAPSKPETA